MACLSDARLCSLISARGASPRWAIRCYGWGCLVARQSFGAGGASLRSQKRSLGLAPTASDRTAGMGDGYGSAGRPAASRRQADSAMRPTAQTQHASSRAVATFALFLFSPLASMSSRRATSLRTPLVAWRLARGSGTWPLASPWNAGSTTGSARPTRRGPCGGAGFRPW